jgi:hypothetical protein
MYNNKKGGAPAGRPAGSRFSRGGILVLQLVLVPHNQAHLIVLVDQVHRLTVHAQD